MSVVTYEITEEQQGVRIDKCLPEQFPQWSRTQIQDWIKEQFILVNEQPVKVKYKVQAGDVVTIDEPEPVELDVVPENLHLNIVYEDADVLVVEKPKGMVVHPSAGHPSGTLVNGLMYQVNDLSGINGVLRPGIVHRIDKDTTGLLIVAKHDESHVDLVNQLVARSVKRQYVALVHGHIPHKKGEIDAPIGRDPRERQNMAVVDDGKEAFTTFTVLEQFGEYTLVQCELDTGRTHQIRVHMQYIGHPIVGDPKYGPKKTLDIGGQALHAQTVGFVHPMTKEYMEFTSPLPEPFEALVESLREKMS
ncbi:RluA family pseudouridine synthase [Planococcaceae bacterium Storch 2/2-2]|nr:RluA family pseudouridine synthase [Planococcaceae bacterium Storch 2/2-2]